MIRLDKLVGARLLSACAGTGAPYLAAEGDVSQPILTEEQIEPQPSPGGAGAVARSSWALFRIRFMLALAAPLFKLIVHHGPNDLFGSTMLTPDLGLPKGPNGTFWFGADQVGRDVFLRTIYGIRTSLVIAFIALFTWPNIARIVRGQVLSLREREFIEAARSLGARNYWIMFRELLPNLVAPIVVYTSL